MAYSYSMVDFLNDAIFSMAKEKAAMKLKVVQCKMAQIDFFSLKSFKHIYHFPIRFPYPNKNGKLLLSRTQTENQILLAESEEWQPKMKIQKENYTLESVCVFATENDIGYITL